MWLTCGSTNSTTWYTQHFGLKEELADKEIFVFKHLTLLLASELFEYSLKTTKYPKLWNRPSCFHHNEA